MAILAANGSNLAFLVDVFVPKNPSFALRGLWLCLAFRNDMVKWWNGWPSPMVEVPFAQASCSYFIMSTCISKGSCQLQTLRVKCDFNAAFMIPTGQKTTDQLCEVSISYARNVFPSLLFWIKTPQVNLKFFSWNLVKLFNFCSFRYVLMQYLKSAKNKVD